MPLAVDENYINTKKKYNFLSIFLFFAPLVAISAPQLLVIFTFIFTLVGGSIFLFKSHAYIDCFAYFKQKPISFMSQKIVRPTDIFFLIFLVYGIFSAFWAINSIVSILLTLKLAGLVVLWYFTGYVLNRTSICLSPFILGYCLACFYIFIMYIPEVSKTTLKAMIQGGLFLSLSFWIVLDACIMHISKKQLSIANSLKAEKVTINITLEKYFLSKRVKISLFILVALSSLITLQYVHCDTAFVAVILGAIVGGILLFSQNTYVLRSLQALIVLAFLLTPTICFLAFKPDYMPFYNTMITDSSYLHRLHLWHETSKKIYEKPLLGYGLGNSKEFSTDKKFDLHFITKNGKKHVVGAEIMGLHPHNIALQLWLELGWIGALWGGLLSAFVFGKIYAILDRSRRFCLMGFFTTAMVTFWVNLGTFQTWWLSSILLLMHLFQKKYIHKNKNMDNI